MLNAVEEYPGQIRQLEDYIEMLEREVERLKYRITELETTQLTLDLDYKE
jgi:prefoldin subunit 5